MADEPKTQDTVDIDESASYSVEKPVPSPSPQKEFDQHAFEATQNLVAVKTSQADELRQKIKGINESIKNIAINDPQLVAAEEKANQAKVEVTKRKKDITQSPEVISFKTQLREYKEDLKDLEVTLSTQLLNLFQITGVKEFETVTGEVREFDIKAKVKGKKRSG